MRELAVFILFFTIVSCGLKTPKNNISIPVKPAGITEIKFDKNMHDFGKLKAGEIVVFTFSFSNIGDNNYLIDHVETDCGCTQVNFEKKLIAPGEKGKIDVELNTAGMVGRELKTIDIFGNSKELKHLAIFVDVENELIEIKN